MFLIGAHSEIIESTKGFCGTLAIVNVLSVTIASTASPLIVADTKVIFSPSKTIAAFFSVLAGLGRMDIFEITRVQSGSKLNSNETLSIA